MTSLSLDEIILRSASRSHCGQALKQVVISQINTTYNGINMFNSAIVCCGMHYQVVKMCNSFSDVKALLKRRKELLRKCEKRISFLSYKNVYAFRGFSSSIGVRRPFLLQTEIRSLQPTVTNTIITRSSHHRCSMVKSFLEISQYSQENTRAKILPQMFCCEFCEISKNTF